MRGNDKAARAIIAEINSSWASAPLAAGTAVIWTGHLAKFPVDDVMRALSALVARCKFRPSLSEIIAELVTDPDAETSREAFSAVWKAIGSVGRHGEPEISDAALTAVRHLGGWGSICGSWTLDRREWHLREFCAAYEQVSDREHSRTLRALSSPTTKAIG